MILVSTIVWDDILRNMEIQCLFIFELITINQNYFRIKSVGWSLVCREWDLNECVLYDLNSNCFQEKN